MPLNAVARPPGAVSKVHLAVLASLLALIGKRLATTKTRRGVRVFIVGTTSSSSSSWPSCAFNSLRCRCNSWISAMICCSSMESCCSLLGGAGGCGEASAMAALQCLRGFATLSSLRELFAQLSRRPARALGGARARCGRGYSDASVGSQRERQRRVAHALVMMSATQRAAQRPTPPSVL